MPNIVESNTPPLEKDEWRTLPALYDWLDDEFGFGYDFAATDENSLATGRFTKERSALDSNDWFHFGTDVAYLNTTGFLNPPFSQVGEFLAKANEQVLLAGEKFVKPVIVCLVRADAPETKWWRDNVLDSDGFIRHEVRYLYPRLPYCDPSGEVRKNILWPSALVIMRPIPWRYVRWFNWKQNVGER